MDLGALWGPLLDPLASKETRNGTYAPFGALCKSLITQSSIAKVLKNLSRSRKGICYSLWGPNYGSRVPLGAHACSMLLSSI